MDSNILDLNLKDLLSSSWLLPLEPLVANLCFRPGPELDNKSSSKKMVETLYLSVVMSIHSNYSNCFIAYLNNKTKYFVLRWFDDEVRIMKWMRKLRARDIRECAEILPRDCWETAERLLRDCWETPERLLKDWLLRDCWRTDCLETTKKLKLSKEFTQITGRKTERRHVPFWGSFWRQK